MNSKALCCFLFLLSFAACRRDSAGAEDVAPVLEITDRRVNAGSFGIEAGAGTQYIEIRTNVADWVADTGGEGWLTAEPLREPETPATGVAVVQKLKITASQNPHKVARTAAVSISGGGITLTLDIVQAAADDILAFDTPVYAKAAGEILEIPVTANVAFTVSVPEACGWIEDLTASDANVIRLRIGENDGVKSRNADLEVAAEEEGVGVRKTLTVIQHGSEPAIDIDGPDEIAVAWDEGHFTLNVTANVAYNVVFDPEAEWIWRSAATRAAAKEERFGIGPNEATETRAVTICFVSEDGAVSPAVRREIRVVQEPYALPSEEVFELASAAGHTLPYESRSFGVEIRTGRDAAAITVGGADGWIGAAPQPERIRDVLIYTFHASENVWPLKRDAVLSFTSGSATIEVPVRQDENPKAGRFVGYKSVSGGVPEGSVERLLDCDTATGLTSGSSGWPQEWRLELENPSGNEFNRLIYHPLSASPGIGGYELLAFSGVNKTWYSVAAGTVPESFYTDENAVRKGWQIDFPTVENAQSLILRVDSAHGGAAFGASEIHLTHDFTQNIAYTPTLNILSAPATIAHGASSFTVGVEAAVPFKVALSENGGAIPDWIAYDHAAAEPGTLVFNVSANRGSQRSVTVTLTATTGYGLNKSFTVVQAAPFFYLLSPDPAEISLAADPDPAIFEIVLATGADPADITVGPVPDWLTAGNPIRADGTATYPFTATANDGDSRSAELTFTNDGGLTVSVAVRQTGRRFAGVEVRPTQAVWFSAMNNYLDAPETIDGDPNTCHTVAAGNIAYYEFRFANNTDLAGFIYYPRDSDTEHGAFRKIKVQAVSRSGGVGVAEFTVEIPQSVYLTPGSRRTGWAVELPVKAVLVSHLRITPVQGWQSDYSVAEVEFFAPE